MFIRGFSFDENEAKGEIIMAWKDNLQTASKDQTLLRANSVL
jgi:hypothetical protein